MSLHWSQQLSQPHFQVSIGSFYVYASFSSTHAQHVFDSNCNTISGTTILKPLSSDASIDIITSSNVSISVGTNVSEWLIPQNEWIELKLDGTQFGFISQSKSIISFKVKGRAVTTDNDIYFGFGDENNYIALFVGMSTKINVPPNMDSPIAMWLFPGCNQTLSNVNITKLLHQVRNIRNMVVWSAWEDIDGINPYISTITIINDDIFNKTTLHYEDTVRSASCQFNGVFKNHHNLYFAIKSDRSDVHRISSIVINTDYGESELQIDPTAGPTSDLTAEPTTDPTIEPTFNPTQYVQN